ncbi:MAG: hypothetical protein GY909_15435 [Oligoflexia bacterium]|nr:hypothetical protein [Oligoflexia bacterium]
MRSTYTTIIAFLGLFLAMNVIFKTSKTTQEKSTEEKQKVSHVREN